MLNKPVPIVISFCGRSRSGKTTAADYFVHKYGATKVSFADPLKRIAKRVWKFSDRQLYGSQIEKEAIDSRHNTSARVMLQELGTACREELGSDIWIEQCFNWILREQSLSSTSKLFVLEDCRYVNEALAIAGNKTFTGKVVKLIRTDIDLNTLGDFKNHASEVEVDKIPESCIYHTINSYMTPNAGHLKTELDVLAMKLDSHVFRPTQSE